MKTRDELTAYIKQLETKARKMESLLARCAGRLQEDPIILEIHDTIFPLTEKFKE